MKVAYAEANAVQRALRRLVASAPGAWFFARVLDHLDRPVYRLTRGRHTLSSLVSGLPVVMVTTTGRRSGRPRTVPLLGLPTPGGMALIASNFGLERHPGWYHNLCAHPEAELEVAGRRQRCRAVEVEGERRAAIWQQGLLVYPGWAQYEARAPGRRIRVILLEPVDRRD
jgi:deazaflavin-dependent oxidoreductase (nitroreductase family)